MNLHRRQGADVIAIEEAGQEFVALGGFLVEQDTIERLKAFDAKPEETSMECPECGKKLKAGEDDCASCGYSARKLHDDDDDKLFDVEADPGEEALKYLREIRPEVEAKGSDAMKRRWNDAWQAVKAGEHPKEAIDRLRRQYDSRRTADAVHRRHGVAADAQGDECQAVADDLVAKASAFLGQDMAETTAQLRTAKRTCRSFDARRSPSENLVAAAEALGEEMRNRRY